MKNLDQIWSDKIFFATKSSPVFSPLAIFCATGLLWSFTLVTILFEHASTNRSWFGSVFYVGLVMLIPWLIIITLSLIIRRKRPFRAEHHKPLIHMPVETPSFPSAHATLAFSLATVFAHKPVLFTFAILIAITVAIGRVAVGVHYLSDTIAGAIVGLLVSSILFILLKSFV